MNDRKDKQEKLKKEMPENNLSDVEMSPTENVGMSEDEEDEELEEDKGKYFLISK